MAVIDVKKRRKIKTGVRKRLTEGAKSSKKTVKKMSKIGKPLPIGISPDNEVGGVCEFKLTSSEIESISSLITPLSNIEEYIVFQVLEGGGLVVGQNQDEVEAIIVINAEFIDTPKSTFTISLPKKIINELKQVVSDYAIVRVKDHALTLEVGGTVLEMNTEEVDLPHISIDVTEFEESEDIIPDLIENAIHRVQAIKIPEAGVFENYIAISDKIEAGSMLYFTQVKSGLTKTKTDCKPEFLPYIKMIAKCAIAKVTIASNEDYILVYNDVGMYYKSSRASMTVTPKFEEVLRDRELKAKGLFDNRTLASSLKKLAIVTIGVKGAVVNIALKSKKASVFVKSLGGKKSNDTWVAGDLQGEYKEGFNVNLKLLTSSLQILDNNVTVEAYEEVVNISDSEQQILFLIEEG